MGRYLLSPRYYRRALKRISTTWDFSAERWGEGRADSYLRGLWTGISIVADDPRRGHACDLRDGYFQYSVGKHVLFFKLIVEGVDIIRILHQSMDFQRHL